MQHRITNRPWHPTSENAWARVVKVVLLLLVVLIAITPVTQTIWSGDNFLYGHDDTETTLVAGLTLLLLALLIMQQGSGVIEELMCRFKGWFVAFCKRQMQLLPIASLLQRVHARYDRTVASEPSAFPLPLLI